MLTAISSQSYPARVARLRNTGKRKICPTTFCFLARHGLLMGALLHHAHSGCSTSTARLHYTPHHQISQQPPTASSSRRCASLRLNLTDRTADPSEQRPSSFVKPAAHACFSPLTLPPSGYAALGQLILTTMLEILDFYARISAIAPAGHRR